MIWFRFDQSGPLLIAVAAGLAIASIPPTSNAHTWHASCDVEDDQVQ